MCKLDSGLNRELMKRSQYGAKKLSLILIPALMVLMEQFPVNSLFTAQNIL